MVVLNAEYVCVHSLHIVYYVCIICMYVDACICTYVQIYASQCSPWG